jgi:hypothetical protein
LPAMRSRAFYLFPLPPGVSQGARKTEGGVIGCLTESLMLSEHSI